METQQQSQQQQEVKPVVYSSVTQSVNLSTLIKYYTDMLPCPDEWRVLAIDVVNDMVVVVREVKNV